MALFIIGLPCKLCGVGMSRDDRLFATSHFLDSDSDLWQFSDAVMHWDCYAKWEHRARFGRLYFDANRALSLRNYFWGVAHADEQALVTVNPSSNVAEMDITLAETGSGFRLKLSDWERWLGGLCLDRCNHEIEREALLVILPLLRSKLPTADAVIAAARMDNPTE